MESENIQIVIDKIALKLNVQGWDIYPFGLFDPRQSMNRMIDHTFLQAIADESIISELCNDAMAHQFYSICVHPTWIEFAADIVSGTDVKVCSVVGFPLGANTTVSKNDEATDAIAQGANEIDFVMNLSHMKEKKYDLIFEEFTELSETCRRHNAISKVILETCYLTDEEVVQASVIAKIAGLNFVKTSTGLGSEGATEKHVRMMRTTVGTNMGVKASGGIKTKEQAEAMIGAGADRIGSSSSLDLI